MYIKLAILIIFICPLLAINQPDFIDTKENTLYYGIDKNFKIIDITKYDSEQLKQVFENNIFTQIESQYDQQFISACKYQKVVNQTGWHFLQIVSNKNYNDFDQSFAAGKCEGAISYEQIYDAYNNYVNSSVLNGNPDIPVEAQNFISQQYQWIVDSVDSKATNENYWGVVGSGLKQLQGLYEGYMVQVQENGQAEKELDFNHFYYLTYMGDHEDVQVAFEKKDKTTHSCDTFVKYTKTDLLVGQTTFNIYQLMLRIYKKYDLNLNNKLIKNHQIQFSSRPGDLESKDDFYTFSDMVVIESSLLNFNQTNYEYLHYDSLPCWLRVISANKVAKTGLEWSQYFQQHRSGTHNNQWLIVDYVPFRNKQFEGVVHMVEESFYLYEHQDVTKTLYEKGYVAGYNVPYHQNIFDRDNYQQGYEGFTYETDPRAVIFRKYQSQATNIESLKHLLYLNSNELGNICGVAPSNFVTSQIAPRCDTLQEGKKTFGLIDGKIVNNQLLKQQKTVIKSGPSTSGQPIFDWGNFPDELHSGQPETWDFQWLEFSGKGSYIKESQSQEKVYQHKQEEL